MKPTSNINQSRIPLQKQGITGRSFNLQSYFWEDFPEEAKPLVNNLFQESLGKAKNLDRCDLSTAQITAVWDSSFGKIENFSIGYTIQSKKTGKLMEYDFQYPGTLRAFFEEHFPKNTSA